MAGIEPFAAEQIASLSQQLGKLSGVLETSLVMQKEFREEFYEFKEQVSANFKQLEENARKSAEEIPKILQSLCNSNKENCPSYREAKKKETRANDDRALVRWFNLLPNFSPQHYVVFFGFIVILLAGLGFLRLEGLEKAIQAARTMKGG